MGYALNHRSFFSGLCLIGIMSVIINIIPALNFVVSVRAEAATTRIIPIPTAKPIDGLIEELPFKPQPLGNVTFPKEDAILELSALLGESDKTIENGMVWRVYKDEEDSSGKLPLLATFSGGPIELKLPAGFYYVHGSYGYTGQTKRVKVLPPVTQSQFEINAGGLRLNAAFRKGDIIPAEDIKFDIAEFDDKGPKTIVTDVLSDELVRLAPGQYYITSRYGDINSEVSANVTVAAAELTEVTLYQRGAEITLKLVSEKGGEALANTSWTVLTPAGDPVINSIKSAFPSFILAAGDYVAFARHDDKNYSSKFTIESGVHRDVEVLLKPE